MGARLGLITYIGEVLLVNERIFEMRPELERILVRVVIQAELKYVQFSSEYKEVSRFME